VGDATNASEAATPAIVFPGQGAQSVGMAGDWVEACPQATELFARASAILGYDLFAVCRSGPSDRLNTTAISQPAILVTSLALLEVLRARDADKPGGCAVDGAVGWPERCSSAGGGGT
jgi:[acyl-carrier-protein] S-malonyltransferase